MTTPKKMAHFYKGKYAFFWQALTYFDLLTYVNNTQYYKTYLNA